MAFGCFVCPSRFGRPTQSSDIGDPSLDLHNDNGKLVETQAGGSDIPIMSLRLTQL